MKTLTTRKKKSPESNSSPRPRKSPAGSRGRGKTKPEPIYVDIEDFELAPVQHVMKSSATQLVMVRDKSGEVICIYGGCLS